MGLLDFLKEQDFTSDRVDPGANARALMGGQPMQQYNNVYGEGTDTFKDLDGSYGHEDQHAIQDIPTGPKLHEPTQFSTIEPEEPRVPLQVPEGNYPNQRPIFNQNLGGMDGQGGYDPVAELMKRKEIAQNPILNSNTYQEPTSPYPFTGYPNQLGNPNESNLTQVNSDPFSWIKSLLSPDTLSPEELRKRGF